MTQFLQLRLSYPEKLAGSKPCLKADRFKEHFNQAQTFYNSLSPHEKPHVELELGFELDHCIDSIVYNRMSHRLAVSRTPHLARA